MGHSGCQPKPSRLPIHIPTIERMSYEKGVYSGFMLHTPFFNAWGVSHASTKITVAWVAVTILRRVWPHLMPSFSRTGVVLEKKQASGGLLKKT
jgi:hypothetical protein